MTAPLQDPVAPTLDPDLQGPGSRLRAGRESVGLSLGEVAARMHLDARTVRALEADRYEDLPAPAFVRGYLRGYARLLSIAAEPLVEAFDRNGLAPPALVADISERPQAQSTDFPVQIVTYLIVAGLLVLVFLWWRSQEFDPAAPDAATSEPQLSTLSPAPGDHESRIRPLEEPDPALAPPTSGGTGAVADRPEPAAASADTTDPGAATPPTGGADRVVAETGSGPDGTAAGAGPAAAPPASSAAPDPASAATAGIAGESPPSTDPANAAAADPVPGVAAAAAPPGAAGNQVSIKLEFGEDSWVEVHDRNDSRLLYALAKAGRVTTVEGEAPLRVLLGRTRNVTMSINGERADFGPFVNRGIARFRVGDAGALLPPATGPGSEDSVAR